jgi:hypothetical protein
MNEKYKGIKKPFIPRNKPKSFIIAILAGLTCFFGAAPIIFAGHFLELSLIKTFGMILFFLCVVTFFIMWFIGMVQMIRGKYRKMEERYWKDQVW